MERAPWWGGFYERLIRTVKLALRKTVGRATLFRDELETLLIEIKGVLNSRPLTYIFSEFNEPEPLTPSHMILGRRVNSLPPARLNFDSNLSNRKVLIKSTVSSVLTNQPRLPKLTLESFSGKDISSFPSFWARFKSAVHENSSLNDVDKFSYLKSVVTSDAELAARGLTLISENYAKAMKILEDRFGRKELIVDFHMNRLLNLTPVRVNRLMLLS
ncbi:integrase catalytic domain-containing protein [Trichonephila clavipes]|nr:integrase catalytic domain-containing protein [Trichonephila clavipes]